MEALYNMDPMVILAFMSAGILLNLTPGADVVFSTACSVSGGWRSGIAAAAGISLGSMVHVMLAAVGVSAAIMALPWAYDAIRFAGAAYLLFLAVKTWRSSGSEASANGTQDLAGAFRKGLLTNLLNPKVALFILALLPQFTRLEAGPMWQQILILGTLFATTGFLIVSGYAVLAGVFGAALRRSTGFLNKLTALVFGGLAARLLLD